MRPHVKLITATAAFWMLTGCGGQAVTAANQRSDTTVATANALGTSVNNIASNTSCLTGAQTLDLQAQLVGSVGYTDTMASVINKDCATCHSSTGQQPDLSTFAAASAAAASSINAINLGVMPPSGSPQLAAADTANFQAWIAGGLMMTANASSSTPGTAAAPSPVAASPAAVATPSATNTCAAPTTPTPAQAPTNAVATAPQAPTPAPATPAAAAPAAPTPVAPAAPAPAPTTTTPAVTYANTVKSILDINCISCHGPGSNKGDFSTYTGASNYASTELSQIQGGMMPPGGKLTSAQIASFKAWVDTGAK